MTKRLKWEKSSKFAIRLNDGLLMAAQYDLTWSEEAITGWHFYDTAQSLLYAAKGFDVGVAHQPSPWAIHYCGDSTMKGYYEALPAFQQWRKQLKQTLQ
ncbi:glycosyltransferase [Shouchella miscanthi]|uniref:Glycosyltransferase n=1 Tax=Shouchella miscanthi TaxID=2598861 RepID=A0ABU6NPA1_9BACI|nr:glycosyltransferase [Shouchella miscanthi]